MGLDMGDSRTNPDALRGDAEVRFGALLTYCNDSVLILDAFSGRLINANPSACAHFQIQTDATSTIKLSDLFPPSTYEQIQAFLNEAKQDGPFKTRVFVTLPGNADREGRLELGIAYEQADGSAYTIIVAREATGHARAEEGLRKNEAALRQSEDKYRTILENI